MNSSCAHVLGDDDAVEDVGRGEHSRVAVPLVVVGHRAELPVIQRHNRLRAVERWI